MPAADPTPRYLQYGSGPSGAPGWLNVDASPTLRAQRLPVVGALVRRTLPEGRFLFDRSVVYGDVVAGLPVEPGSFRGVYCSHVLEHLALDDCHTALRNTFTYLAPGGLFRLVMPDLRALAEAYLAVPGPDAAHQFMERAWLGRPTRPRSVANRAVAALGVADHLWMWDERSMAAALERHGFVDVRRAEIGDSEDPRFAEVEDPSRWAEPGFDGTPGTLRCLGMEARRPP